MREMMRRDRRMGRGGRRISTACSDHRVATVSAVLGKMN